MYNNFSSKKTKKVISALLASALVVTSAPITASAATKKVVGVGKTVTYKAGATVKKITVKNKKVVKATKSKKNKKNVVLKGLKAGKTTVTIKTSKKTIKLNVCVGATKITKKTLKTTMTAGTTQTVSVTATGGKGDTIKFASSNKAVLKVNKTSAKASTKGIAKMGVAAVAEGTAKLTVSSKYTGVKKSFTIKVTAAQPAPTQAPTVVSTPGITTPTATVAATNAPSAVTTPGVTAPGTTDAAGATNVPGTTDNASSEAPTATDAVASPEATTEPTVAPSFDPETAKEGTLTVTTNVSGASIKVISGGATAASLTMGALETSATTATLAAGVYTVEISKKGYDTVTQTVVIDGNQTLNVSLVETLIVGASAKVENSLVGYDDVVLVNDNAIVTVTMRDADGNPVANKSVVLSLSNPIWAADSLVGVTLPRDAGFEVKGNTVVTTDADGKATFVVGQKGNVQKATEVKYAGSTEFRASVVGSNESTTGCVGFASIDVGAVSSVDANLTDLSYGNITPGENFTANSYDDSDAVHTTQSLNNDNVEYILSQQVSSEGGDEHALTFKVNPSIYIPRMSKTTTAADDFYQEVNETSGKYGTYDSITKDIPLKVDTSSLQYATLNFSNISLSPYSKLTIKAYNNLDKKPAHCIDTKEIDGGKIGLVQKDFAYQIPVQHDTVKVITVTIASAGQVETDMNDGYVISDITGVYNKASDATSGGYQTLNTASVKWEAVKPTMSEIQKLDINTATDKATLQALGLDVTGDKIARYDYQVPVFPNTGDAVIRAYDTNEKIVAYYLAATMKDAYNTNVLDTSKKAYKATAEEAETVIETGVTQDGNSVTVNSEKVGSTTLRGTISIAGLGNDLLDAANSRVYTSVQWNPIPKTTVSESNAFVAIAGQKVTVYAQLTDKNGNPVSLADQDITYTTSSGTTKTITTVETGKTEFGGAGVVKVAKTDVNGRATLVLSSADAREVLNIEASGGTQYDAKLVLGDSTVEQADLYWVNANLQFLKNVGDTTYGEAELAKDLADNGGVRGDYVGKINTTTNNTIDLEVAQPSVGTPWEYGIKAVGDKIADQKGILSGYDIDINGLKINMTSNDDNKGTYEVVDNGKMSATSEYSKKDKLQAKLNQDSVVGDITFTAKKTDYPTLTLKCVGEGRPNMNSRINLSVDWKVKGAAVNIVAPNGTTIGVNNVDYDDNGTKDQTVTKLYVKVTDETGKNPIDGKTVTFTSNNDDDKLSKTFDDAVNNTSTFSTLSNTLKVETDDKGVATVYVLRDASGDAATLRITSSIISAKVDDIEQVASTTINYVKPETDHPLGVVRAKMVEKTNNQIELTFNDDLNTESVMKDEFTLTAKDPTDTKTLTYEIESVKASGNKVILTTVENLTANEYTVAIDKYTKDKITYNLTNEIGRELVSDETSGSGLDEVKFYSAKNASFEVNVDDNKVTISSIKTPNADDQTAFDGGVTTIGKFVVVVDGEYKTLTSGGAMSDYIVLNSDTNATGGFSFTVPTDSDEHDVYVYYMGGSDSVTVKSQEDIANGNIASDARDVVTAGVKDAGTSTGTKIDFGGATGDKGSTLTYRRLDSGTDVTLADGGSRDITVGGIADGTAIFDIKISKANGDDVYKTFKVTYTHAGTTYKCEDITGKKAANDAYIKAAKADVSLFPASYSSAAKTQTVKITSDAANTYGVTLTWESNDTSAVTVGADGKVTALSHNATGKTVTCTITKGDGTQETVVYDCTFGGSAGAETVTLAKHV